MNMMRRALLGIPALAVLGVNAATAAAADGKPKTFVLVHGAWHGGWCWKLVRERLMAAGHTVYTPTLSGMGERSHLLGASVNLTTHVMDVANVIKWEELKEVVLVGHSYAGAVITGVADLMPEAIRTLVYVDAFITSDEVSIDDISSKVELPEAFKSLREVKPGQLTLPAPPSAFFGVPKAYQPWADRLLTPMPVAPQAERRRLTGAYKRIPRNLYIASGPNIIFQGVPDPEGKGMEELRKNPTWRTATVEGGHDLMISSPDPLADLLLDA